MIIEGVSMLDAPQLFRTSLYSTQRYKLTDKRMGDSWQVRINICPLEATVRKG